MTPEQRKLAQDLLILPPSGKGKVSKQDFAVQFPSALDNDKLELNLLKSAREHKKADDLQCALIIGHAFGFSSEHEDCLCQLISEDWHTSHEDVVSALEQIGSDDQKTANALYEAAQLSLPYLEYDDSKALAVKAIWALGKMADKQAKANLRLLADSPNPILRWNAEKQLSRGGN